MSRSFSPKSLRFALETRTCYWDDFVLFPSQPIASSSALNKNKVPLKKRSASRARIHPHLVMPLTTTGRETQIHRFVLKADKEFHQPNFNFDFNPLFTYSKVSPTFIPEIDLVQALSQPLTITSMNPVTDGHHAISSLICIAHCGFALAA